MFLLIFVLHICFNQYSYLFIWNGGILCQRTTILFPITMYTCRSGVRCSDLIISANRCMIILNCPWLFPEAVHYNLMIICTVSGKMIFFASIHLHFMNYLVSIVSSYPFCLIKHYLNRFCRFHHIPASSVLVPCRIIRTQLHNYALCKLTSSKQKWTKKMATNFATGHISIMLWILCTFISV